MEHVVAYEGLVKTSLGILLKEYGPLYVPSANRPTGIEGTMQRAPYTLADFDTYVDSLHKEKNQKEAFAILAHCEEGGERTYRYIGHTGLHGIRWPDASATTGSVTSHVDSQGVGHGTEAKLLLLYHSFRKVGLRNIKSMVKGWNAKSLGHLLKCGYRIRGRFEKMVFHNGTLVDEIILQCAREDFEPVWEQYQDTGVLPKLTDEQRAIVTTQTK